MVEQTPKNIPSMAQKQVAVGDETQVIGQVMLAFLDNLRAEEVKPLLAKIGLNDIEPETWYPQQVFVDLYQQLEQQGQSESIVAIGMKTLDALAFPPEVNDIPGALQILPAMYGQIHQNLPPEEGWDITLVSDQHIQVVFNSPYSDHAAFGYLYSIARRFRPQGATFTVRPERFGTGGPALFNVTWG